MQLVGGGARLVGDGGAGQHAGDLLAAAGGVQLHHPRRRGALGAAGRPLAFSTRQCLTARAATCGEWVTTRTCSRAASCASRSPTAAAVAPPTPLSTSSNTSVGTGSASASTTFSASRKRDSSPPDAIFASGPGGRPGFVATSKATRSSPCSPQSLSGSRSKRVREAGLVQLQRRQLGGDRAVQLLRRLVARGAQRFGRRHVGLPRGGFRLRRAWPAGRSGHPAPPAFRPGPAPARPADPPARCACARDRAARTAAPRSAPAASAPGRDRAAAAPAPPSPPSARCRRDRARRSRARPDRRPCRRCGRAAAARRAGHARRRRCR